MVARPFVWPHTPQLLFAAAHFARNFLMLSSSTVRSSELTISIGIVTRKRVSQYSSHSEVSRVDPMLMHDATKNAQQVVAYSRDTRWQGVNGWLASAKQMERRLCSFFTYVFDAGGLRRVVPKGARCWFRHGSA